MAVTIDDYLAYVSPEVEGCPRGVMVRNLTAAAIRFCRQSYYLNKSQAITLLDGVRAYLLDPEPNDFSMIAVLEAKFDGREVLIKDREWMNFNLPYWENSVGTAPQIAWSEDGVNLSVYPLPNAQVLGNLTVKMAVQPLRDSLAWLPDLADNYLEIIAHGAKATLMMMKGRSWYDPGQAAYCEAMFKNGYLEAKREVIKGFSNQSISAHSYKLGA